MLSNVSPSAAVAGERRAAAAQRGPAIRSSSWRRGSLAQMKIDSFGPASRPAATARCHLLAVYAAALERVNGRAAVRRHLANRAIGDTALVAIGKAAEAMALGALDALGEAVTAGLVITKRGYRTVPMPPAFSIHESGHPVPDAASLDAGAALLRFIEAQPPARQLLFLISGGASSLVEVLRPGVTLELLQSVNSWLVASGLPIDRVNVVRRGLSLIKGGGLLRWIGGRRASCLLISDVPGDDPRVIGSGLLVYSPPAPLPTHLPDWLVGALTVGDDAGRGAACETEIVARPEDALAAAAERAAQLGHPVHWHSQFIRGSADAAGRRIGGLLLKATDGFHLWGGETTLTLPDRPGRGGRNQHLALAAATVIAGQRDVALLAAATDGSDGPGEDAGGLVDGGTLARGAVNLLDADAYLRRADSGTFLEVAGDLIQTGPTGTNVMDLVLALKGPVRVDRAGMTADTPAT